ncbi:unnamed protein product [Dibothriocephalus latus]|uniref:G-protein coupled receptors family 1 profile domain-containing protein n=1 Tax=Dibothriocephalus latus TaxID=60516 RepID=A0A3P6TC71_DIBLA|nr:unnamed protein product [Dibothriocephalus latus]
MEDLDKIDLLPTVSKIPSMNASTYRKYAEGVAANFENCELAKLMSIEKVVECTTTSLLPLSGLSSNASFENASPKCYDDYNCDPPDYAYLFYVIFGLFFTVVCSASFLSNLACVVAFNKASNRTGATLYFSAIALADCLHLSILLLLHVPRFLHETYAEQIDVYARFTVRSVPKALPFLTFSELASVWLTLCVLADRYTYLRLGFFSRSVTSSTLHLRVTSVVLVLTFCYTIPKFFEFELQPVHDDPGLYRAMLTPVGKSGPFRNIMDHLLRVPIEMFIPYLVVSVITCLNVSKMVDFGSSKWKAVASLCSPHKYGSLGCCWCGDDFANCNIFRRSPTSAERATPSPTNTTTTAFPKASPEKLKDEKETVVDQVYYCGIPFEKRSSLMPFYFLLPPPKMEIQESANVVIAVCLGFLLVLTKFPKLILHVLTTEHYIDYDDTYLALAYAFLNLAFIAFKPMIYLVLGVHFRHALTGFCCCACLYTPRMRSVHSSLEHGFRESSIQYTAARASAIENGGDETSVVTATETAIGSTIEDEVGELPTITRVRWDAENGVKLADLSKGPAMQQTTQSGSETAEETATLTRKASFETGGSAVCGSTDDDDANQRGPVLQSEPSGVNRRNSSSGQFRSVIRTASKSKAGSVVPPPTTKLRAIGDSMKHSNPTEQV